MPTPIMLDTNVIVDYTRDQPQAIEYLDNLNEVPIISAVVVGELYAGVREGGERQGLDKLLETLRVAPVDYEISIRGGLYVRDYRPSHNVGLPDALIAAAAEAWNATLVTLNRKHFPMLTNVWVPYGNPG